MFLVYNLVRQTNVIEWVHWARGIDEWVWGMGMEAGVWGQGGEAGVL